MRLKRRLHADVLLGRNIVRRDEDPLDIPRHFIEVDVALVGDALHQLLGVPTPFLRTAHEVRIHIRHQHACLIPHECDREQRLDPT